MYLGSLLSSVSCASSKMSLSSVSIGRKGISLSIMRVGSRHTTNATRFCVFARLAILRTSTVTDLKLAFDSICQDWELALGQCNFLGPFNRARIVETAQRPAVITQDTITGILIRQAAARPNKVAIDAWDGRLTYRELAWKGRSDCHGIHNHALFEHSVADGHVARFLQMADEDKLDYFGAYLAYERLRLIEDPNDGFSGPNFCKNKVLLIEYREFASAAMRTHNDGRKQYSLLATCFELQPSSKESREAQS